MQSLKNAAQRISKACSSLNLRIGELLGLAYYTHPQTYSVCYSVEVTNPSSKELKPLLILPVPQDTINQKLLEKPSFNLKPGSLEKEPKYHNLYAFWRLSLPSRTAHKVELKFIIKVSPNSLKSSKTYSLYDYKNLDTETKNPYLEQNKYMSYQNTEVKTLLQSFTKEGNLLRIIQNLNQYVIQNLRYGKPIQGLYTAEEALTNPEVDCGGFDTLLGSLCLALGIPVRIVSGFWAGYKENGMHAWLEILLPDGSWLSADPSIEQLRSQGRTEKVGRLGFVGSDRIILSHGCDIPIRIEGKTYLTPILQNPYLSPKSNLQVTSKFETRRL